MSAEQARVSRRRLLIATYLQSANVAEAMRVAGLASRRSAYHWIRRYREFGASGLESEPRTPKSTQTSEHDEKRILRVRVLHPVRGRRSIATQLGLGSARVGTVLRHLEADESRAPLLESRTVTLRDPDEARTALLNGIHASLNHLPDDAVASLEPALVQLRRSTRFASHLRDRHLGPLVLRSHIQLGHSLMNTGDWDGAVTWLGRAIQLARLAAPNRWDEPDVPLTVVPALVEVEARGYLATILRDTNPQEARRQSEAALTSALKHRPIGENECRTVGNLLRNRARLLIADGRARRDDIEIELRRARGLLEAAGDELMMAATDMQFASLQSELILARDEFSLRSSLDAGLESVVSVLDRHDSPILRANFVIDGVRLRERHALTNPIDHVNLRNVATEVATRGYGDQARKLISLEASLDALPASLFRSVARLALRDAS